ncbi:PREDICTED: amyloid beta A4 precursor protein-binding family B member 1-interacting protein-like isoform X2 [Camelina sativa]|uniref:Amyloid beta A4 precursor protein-binding family B member 1-interacting protein-like isoform X2 n=1 Tax=Camelina sativa TaxID=90675 RepID=A0ABM0VTP3_CAMSA|nr:PREDICTED: amyloid beta A4 precursor protein-binding family B member 1-interacting protein-like isoform X2 [Camelina sativa]
MADQSGGLVMMREYRKGNWTLNETMVLIEAKKMDDERRMRRSIGLPPPEQQQDSRSSNKPAELRWKWIEDYCWRKGCMRSQNQCNDKWDNLMRDYKKVREYERRRVESSFTAAESSSSSAAAAAASAGDTPSYWKMEKSERKERNLPSNMLPQTYQALFEVVENKTLPSSTAATAVTAAVAAAIGSGNGSGGGQLQKVLQQQGLGFVVPKVHQIIHQPPPPPAAVIVSLPPPPSQPPPLQPLPRPLLLPPPPPPSFHAQPILPTDSSSSDSDTSEYSDTSPAKRRRTMPTTTAGPSGGGVEAEEARRSKRDEEETTVAAALSRSVTVIANAIRESEERQDRRHKEVMSVQERRLKMEESSVEMNREGMDGLVEAINKLASSIFALASSSSSSSARHNNQHQGGPP